jgi:hypothetical protein
MKEFFSIQDFIIKYIIKYLYITLGGFLHFAVVWKGHFCMCYICATVFIRNAAKFTHRPRGQNSETGLKFLILV